MLAHGVFSNAMLSLLPLPIPFLDSQTKVYDMVPNQRLFYTNKETHEWDLVEDL